MSEQNNEVVNRLNTLIRLVALGLCQNKGQKEQISFLSSAGITPKEIGEILGTTSNTVSVTLSGIRKVKKGKAQPKGKVINNGKVSSTN